METPPQEAKSPVNPSEADEKKVEEPEVKERADEPMEVESKGISRDTVKYLEQQLKPPFLLKYSFS